MGKNKSTLELPRRIMGFKLSKGTRKDIRKLLEMVREPDTRAVAVSAAGGLAACLAERFTEYEFDKRKRAARAH